jgi:uncharacterized protein (DUF433 family)
MQSVLLTTSPPITIDPEVMSGVPVFHGTRVPVQTLFDYLLDDCTITEFLDNFPSVSPAAAQTVLVHAAYAVIQDASSEDSHR